MFVLRMELSSAPELPSVFPFLCPVTPDLWLDTPKQFPVPFRQYHKPVVHARTVGNGKLFLTVGLPQSTVSLGCVST